jgi:hypothetical protein
LHLDPQRKITKAWDFFNLLDLPPSPTSGGGEVRLESAFRPPPPPPPKPPRHSRVEELFGLFGGGP